VAKANETLVSHYEELRRRALDGPAGVSRGAGWAVFIGQGMAAWMEACAALPLVPEPGPLASGPPPVPLPSDLRGELAMVLARMALAVSVEGGQTA
jgi:hypothetical protein